MTQGSKKLLEFTLLCSALPPCVAAWAADPSPETFKIGTASTRFPLSHPILSKANHSLVRCLQRATSQI